MKTIHEILTLDNHQQKNSQWSWGSFNKVKSSLILRVWDVEMEDTSGSELLVLLFDKNYLGTSRAGFNERLKHYNLIIMGNEVSYSVITPVNIHADKWEIKEAKQYLLKGKKGINSVRRKGDKWYGVVEKKITFNEFLE